MLRFPRPLYDAVAEGTAGTGDTTAAGAGAAVAMPEGLPADFWDADKGEVRYGDLGKRFEELTSFKAQQDERLAGVPEKADDYKLELPPDFKLPDGTTFTIDDKDPAIPLLRQFAHDEKLPQSTVSKLLAIEAQRRAQELDAQVAAVQAEEKALGANFPQRKAAMEAFLRTNIPQDQYDAIRPLLTTAKAFEALEGLIEKATTGAVADGNPNGQVQQKTAAEVLFPSMTRKGD